MLRQKLTSQRVWFSKQCNRQEYAIPNDIISLMTSLYAGHAMGTRTGTCWAHHANAHVAALGPGGVVDVDGVIVVRQVDPALGHVQDVAVPLEPVVDLVGAGEALLEGLEGVVDLVFGLSHGTSYAGSSRIRFEGCFSGAWAPPPPVTSA